MSFRSVYCIAASLLVYLGLNLALNRTESPGNSLIIALAAGFVALFPLLLSESLQEVGIVRSGVLMFAVFVFKAVLGIGHFVVFIQPEYFRGNTDYSYFWDFMWLDQSMKFVSEAWQGGGFLSPLGEPYWEENKNAGLLAFMGLNYYVTGSWPLNIVPWNILFAIYSAVLVTEIARSLGSSPVRQQLTYRIVLLLPFNLISSLLWRDTTGQFCIVLGAYLLIQTRHTQRYWWVLLPLAAFLGHLHRDVYLMGIVVAAVFTLFHSARTSRYAPLFVGSFLLLILVASPLGRIVGMSSFGRYVEGDGGISSALPFEKVVAMPVRALRAVMGPFPWTQYFQHVAAYEYQPADYLQHVLNLALLWCALPLAWRIYRQTKTVDLCTLLALILWGLGVMATGIHSSYVSVGMPLLVPLAVQVGNEQFLKRLGLCFIFFVLANIAFVGLGMQGSNFFQNMSGGY